MSDAAKWYVVHTYSGYENKVASSIKQAVENRKLHDLITGVQIPEECVTELKDGKMREVKRKLFPGYVLVKMVLTDESWYLVRNTRGCTGFVGPNSNKPLPLSDEEVAKMGVENVPDDEPERKLEINYQLGDQVRIISGNFTGYSGVVDELEIEKDRVRVLVSKLGDQSLGRETPVALKLNQVELLDE